MKHVIALAIKFSIAAIVFLSTLTLFQVPVSVILTLTLVSIIPAYFIGDLFIYPRFGNLIATIADFAYYTVVVWAFMAATVGTSGTTIVTNALFTAIFISFVEALFHGFYMNRVVNLEEKQGEGRAFMPQFQTEFSEELDGKIHKDDKKD
ncbi:MAG: YndM family protein [Bacillus sp. (in: Bacteria)]|nr:YndM family protein [Bacillus sp. (in: firmicutes)]